MGSRGKPADVCPVCGETIPSILQQVRPAFTVPPAGGSTTISLDTQSSIVSLSSSF